MLSLGAMFRGSALVLLALGTACAPDGDTSPADALVTIDAAIGPFVADPGEEKIRCVVLRLKNAEGAFIRAVRAELADSSHHMTMYTSTDGLEQPAPFDCLPFTSVAQGGRPIFIAQQYRSEIVFPEDDSGVPVGYKIEPEQMVRIEMHYLNATVHPKSVAGRIVLDILPLSAKVTETDIAFWGTSDIHIPPNATWETDVKFVKAMPGIRTFALTTHQHSRGTRMRVWHANDASDTADEPVADGTNWLDPPLEVFRPPLEYGQDKAGLAFKCEWKNPASTPVTYGQSVNDEMCLLWHYYYPGQGFSYVRLP